MRKLGRDGVGIASMRAFAAVCVTGCFAVLAPPVVAAQPGEFTNPCVAHAAATPGLYNSLQQMQEACGQPAVPQSPSPPPAPGTTPAAGVSPASGPCDECTYYIYSGDSENVINAKGCSTETVLFTYPVVSGCEGGANEKWEIAKVSTGYRALVAFYHGTLVCMIAGSVSGENAGAQPCTQPLQSYMEFRRPVVSESCVKGWYYIIPADNHGLTLNVRGGLGKERNIITYTLGCYVNSIWFYG